MLVPHFSHLTSVHCPVSFPSRISRRFTRQVGQRRGTLVNFFSAKNCCSPAANIKISLQSTQERDLSSNFILAGTQDLPPSFHEVSDLKKGFCTEINLEKLDRPVCSGCIECGRFVLEKCKVLHSLTLRILSFDCQRMW